MRLKVTPEICAGCRACEMACSAKHADMYSPELARLRIMKFEPEGTDIPVTCKQCPKAPCVAACPVGALYKDEKTGATLTHADKCIGCGMCVEACPFAAAKLSPDGEVLICDLCGGEPECAAVCPVKAIEVVVDKPKGK